MSQTSLELGSLHPRPGNTGPTDTTDALATGPIAPARLSFLEGMLATWLALEAGRAEPTAEMRRRARAAAEVALAKLDVQQT